MPVKRRTRKTAAATTTKAVNKSLARIKTKAKTALKKIIDRESAQKKKIANATVDRAIKAAKQRRDLGPLNHLSHSIRSAGSTVSTTLTLPVNLVRRITGGKRNMSQKGPLGYGTNTLAHTGGIITSIVPIGYRSRSRGTAVRRRRRTTRRRM